MSEPITAEYFLNLIDNELENEDGIEQKQADSLRILIKLWDDNPTMLDSLFTFFINMIRPSFLAPPPDEIFIDLD